MKALEDALYTKLSGDATLMGYVTGGVHNTVVESPNYPYLVFQKVSSAPDYTLTQIIREPYVYQIRCIAKGYDKTVIMQALAQVRTLLNRQPLTVTGYEHWVTQWESDMPDMADMDDDGEPLVQVGATYRIEVRAE